MVFCTYCGQSFTRDEHLERHILTHTNVKPFKCFTCHMSFARRDLLQRHYTVHGRDQNNQEGLPPNHGMIPKSAGRTPIACSNCAKTKTKCDKKFPCSRCASRNLKCTLRPTRRQSKNANRLQPSQDRTSSTTITDQIQQITPEGSESSSPQAQSVQEARQNDGSTLQTPTSPPPSQVDGDSSVFPRQSPTRGHTPAPQTLLSPIPTPGSLPSKAFMDPTQLPLMMELGPKSIGGANNEAESPFFIDWSQFQFNQGPNPFDTMVDHDFMIGADLTDANISIMMSGMPDTDGAVFSIPELGQPFQAHSPQMTPPGIDGAMTDLELGSSAMMYYSNSRQTLFSDSVSLEIPEVVAAQTGWNCFKSAPAISSTTCPRTAILHLERLEQSLKNHEAWNTWQLASENVDTSQDNLKVLPFQEASRDKLLAITQSILHKALEIHKEDDSSTPLGSASPASFASAFVLLPPSRVLEHFLRAYGNSFERFFPMTSRGVLDVNDLLLNSWNDQASSLLILMMIAQGALAIPSREARWLNGGLTEACRISLFDLIEKNISMASDPTVLQSALLFISLAAWSGDKWQMDIAMGQRGMYFAMLRHSGFLEPRHAMTPPLQQHRTPDSLWNDWLQQETKSRLIYSWVMVDQDLSLFRDTAPLFSVTEFGAPMPDANCLWQAKTVTEWSTAFNEVHKFSGGYSSVGFGVRPLSLRELFRHFLDDEIIAQGIELTVVHLRLLLHPLQGLVHQCCQLLSCFSDTLGGQQRTRAVTAASTRGRLEEVQALLQRWYDLADRYMKGNAMCPMMEANLAIFHLISLNAVTNFPEIERLARKEGFDGSYQQLIWMHKRCISDVEEAIFHAGQVLRLIRAMPKSTRPPWWAGAIYRVALVLWTDSLTHTDSMSSAKRQSGPSLAIDSLAADHPLIVRYLTKREGFPTLTKRDGGQIPLDHAFTVLSHCVDVIDEGIATRFTDGIRNKLERLAHGG